MEKPAPGEVILVDEEDRRVGVDTKIPAHVEGKLHRAFSVFLFNAAGDWLLQKRASAKYHSAGLWSNACCSHPAPGEDTAEAAARRLKLEMGVGCPLDHAFGFVYEANLDHGLIEHEYDHVFIGRFDGTPSPDPAEVGDWRWVREETLAREVDSEPGRFTCWFVSCFERVRDYAASRP